MLKTNSTLSASSHSSLIDNIQSTNLASKASTDGQRYTSIEPKNTQRKQLSQIKFQKAKKNYTNQNIKKICKNQKIFSGATCSAINPINLGATHIDANLIQSINSSKQPSAKRKSKHSR